ncbi:MAG: hypothetical protein LBQ67_06575 [Treponema sp.]|jgi:hypothetical protein|nr:hypothetical protein [Treponema sp.]
MADSSGGKDRDQGEAVFYYSRDRRLERASPAVRALYDEAAPRPGLLQSLGGRKSNLFLLVSILIVCTALAFSSRVLNAEKGFKLGGNTVALTIARNDQGSLSVFMQKTIPPSGEVYTGAVAVAVSPVIPKQDKGKTPEIYTDKVFFTPVEEEGYRFDLPFEGDDFLVVLQTENERKGLRIKAKKIRG